MQEQRPIMVILFNRQFISSLNSQHAPEGALGYMESARAVGIDVYFCSVDDIDTSNHTMYGWRQDTQGNWVHTTIPWPNFFYDQGKDMPQAERAEAEALRKTLPQLVTPINSRRFLDKWFLHRALARYPIIARLLPDTRLGRCPQHLKVMFKRYWAVIVKPTNSSRGRGISVVRLSGRKSYRVQSYKGDVAKNQTIEQAFRLVLHNAGRDQVLLQRYLKLQKAGGRRFDLRMLMGKNAHGVWIVASPRMRLGQKDSLITNTNRGADRMPLLENLQEALGQQAAQKLYAKAEHLSVLVCRYIERVVGPMGEIGLDFILDQDMRLWFIEANPQPGKTPLPQERVTPTPLLYRHVMEYCTYLWSPQPNL